jgi:site-specific recombinase XerC
MVITLVRNVIRTLLECRSNITKDSMRQAFAAYAESHEASSIRRCWSTWNTLCSCLFTADQLPANPMQLVGRPKPAKTLPKSLPQSAAQALLNSIDTPAAVKRRTDWPERDRAVILTALLAGLRAQELRGANVGDLRVTEDRGGVLHVRGKGNKDRTVPIEAALIDVITAYLTGRAARFPATPVAAPARSSSTAGRPTPHCSLATTATESRAEPYNTAYCAPSSSPAPTPTTPRAPSCTHYDTPTPPS